MSLKLFTLAVLLGSTNAIFDYKVCPLENETPECRSRNNQYKCSGWLVGDDLLTPAYSPTPDKWIGGLPDALRNKNVREDPEVRATFGDLDFKDFRVVQGKCSDTLANARCYGALLKASQKTPESCSKTIYNPEGDEIVGDIFCKRIGDGEYTDPGKNRIGPLTAVFKYSACTGPWNPVADSESGGQLQVEEKFCCERANPQSDFKFVKCNGGPVDRSCSRNGKK